MSPPPILLPDSVVLPLLMNMIAEGERLSGGLVLVAAERMEEVLILLREVLDQYIL